MHKPSPEQQVVLDHVRDGKNVIVEACAGSGKSTTILSMAQSLNHLHLLQFTYNKMLRLEIKDKAMTLKLNNLEVHTFHSFAVKHYTDEAAVDTGIRHLLTTDMQPRQAIPAYDVIVLDECQDMTPLFFQLVHKAIQNLINTAAAPDHKVQLVVLGDARQTLYEFKGADSRFLTLADALWKTCPHLRSPHFERCTLRTSYRLTQPMASFVNHAMLGQELMVACRDGPQVTYFRRPRHQIEDIILYRIQHFLKKGDTPADFFILAYSVKSGNHNIVRLANKLVEANIPIHIPAFETDEMDDCVVDGKVVFSSFHTAKGRERKHVFLIGFDTSYFSFAGGTTEDKTVCPNTLYVGCTRATQNLFLCEYDSACPLDFLHMNHHQLKQCGFVDFKGIPQTNFFPQDDFCNGGPSIPLEIVTRDVTPTKLTKFVNDSILDELTPLLDRIFVTEFKEEEEHDAIVLPRMIRTRMGLYEDISDLNGIAIPAYYYDHLLVVSNPNPVVAAVGDQSLRNIISNKMVRWQQKNEHGFLMRQVEKLPTPRCHTIADYLYLANVCVCAQEELYFKLKQIDPDEYTWLSDEVMQRCVQTLDKHLGPAFASSSPHVEHVLIDKTNEMEQARQRIDEALFPYFGHELRFKFVARADVVTPDTLWELKCVQKLSQEHLMQTAIYAWIQRVIQQDPTTTTTTIQQQQTKILNVRTGEVRRLEATLEELTHIVVLLLKNKFAKTIKLGDDAFLSANS
ncbi:hypothetical protein EBR57_06890 [bacterium]|nr:hypothetical protein [bacterium]